MGTVAPVRVINLLSDVNDQRNLLGQPPLRLDEGGSTFNIVVGNAMIFSSRNDEEIVAFLEGLKVGLTPRGTYLLTSSQYVALKGVQCPACRSDNIAGGMLILSDSEVPYVGVECYACGSRWRDTYELKGYSNFERGER